MPDLTELRVRCDRVPKAVAAAAEAVLGARGEPGRVKGIFERSHVPMVMVDGRRRYVEANRPARLAFRLSREEMRTLAIDDLTPAHRVEVLKRLWARLLESGSVAGRYQVAGPDGSRFDIVYYGVAEVVPRLHLVTFAPADWPEDELDPDPEDERHVCVPLSPRETELLALTADGLGGPELAQALWLSPATVNTHFKRIYEKLDVSNRSAAVAKAMRLGMIE
ncbi:MAG TPA: LuxR C-terminal-related transcriptional regulator [Solirubrobacteraceae bacterium]|nr:LuxR C-terminal-related transcriptional regulator [Solirubrobacteraceae bacterium]